MEESVGFGAEGIQHRRAESVFLSVGKRE